MSTLGNRVRAERERLGLSQKELAERIGVTQQTIAPIEKNRTKNPRHIIELAEVLGVDLRWLKTGEGAKTQEEAENAFVNNVPVLGCVGESGVVGFYEKATEFVHSPDNRNRSLAALTISGDALMPLIAKNGLIYYQRHPTSLPDAVGRECIVELNDGRHLLRFLMPGSQNGKFTLHMVTAPTLLDQEVISARLVAWVQHSTI